MIWRGHRNKPVLSCVRRDVAMPLTTEPSLILEGDTAHLWTRQSDGYKIYYRTSTDLKNWTVGNGGNPVLDSSLFGTFPYVFQDAAFGAGYFMAVMDLWGNLYLQYSTDKVTWTVCNGGYPNQILSPVPGGDFAWIGNPTICSVGGVWHLLIDGVHDLGGGAYDWVQGYSYAAPTGSGANTMVSFQANLTADPVFIGGCATLIHVSDRNALLATTAEIDGRASVVHTKLVAYVASLDDDLALEASWRKTGFNLIGDPATSVYGPADATILANPSNANFPRGVWLYWNWEQWDAMIAFSSMTLTEFYDAITTRSYSVTV